MSFSKGTLTNPHGEEREARLRTMLRIAGNHEARIGPHPSRHLLRKLLRMRGDFNTRSCGSSRLRSLCIIARASANSSALMVRDSLALGLRLGVAARGGHAEPHEGARRAFRDPLPPAIHCTDRGLRPGVALSCQRPEQLHRRRIVAAVIGGHAVLQWTGERAAATQHQRGHHQAAQPPIAFSYPASSLHDRSIVAAFAARRAIAGNLLGLDHPAKLASNFAPADGRVLGTAE